MAERPEGQVLVVKARRSERAGTLLDADDVMTLAVIGGAGFPLRSQAKRKIRRWLQEAQPYASSKKPELQLSDVVVIRLDPAFRDAFKHLSSYREGRERFIESNPEVRRGEPVEHSANDMPSLPVCSLTSLKSLRNLLPA